MNSHWDTGAGTGTDVGRPPRQAGLSSALAAVVTAAVDGRSRPGLLAAVIPMPRRPVDAPADSRDDVDPDPAAA